MAECTAVAEQTVPANRAVIYNEVAVSGIAPYSTGRVVALSLCVA